MSDWTKDADGEYVRWNEPPYRQEGGILHLVLEGEDPHTIPHEIRVKRIHEYYALVKREFARRKPRTREEHLEHMRAALGVEPDPPVDNPVDKS